MDLRRLIPGLLAFVACGQPAANAPELVGARNLKPAGDVGLLAQRTVYVPIYSSLHVADHVQPVDLGATLSLRNIGERGTIVITAVDYYDSDGALVRSFLDEPAELGPLMSAEFFVARADRTGGSGANFLVRWGRRDAGPDLLVEAVMLGRDGNAGISLLAKGQEVR
jgi:hypothetical protein